MKIILDEGEKIESKAMFTTSIKPTMLVATKLRKTNTLSSRFGFDMKHALWVSWKHDAYDICGI